MSTAKNRITRSVAPKSLFEDATALTDATISYNQGDLLCLDGATFLIRKLALETEAASILGIATETVVNGALKSPYTGTSVDASAALGHVPGPTYGVIAKMILKTGDSINPGGLVYWFGDQTVSATGTKAIGVYQGKAIASAVAGTEVEVLLGARSPNDQLNF
jgi:hypothetical protein